MRNEMPSFFEDPEFKNSLARYEGMVENHTRAYFDADELTGIAEYYTTKGRHKDADQVIDFALQLHPNDIDALIFKARALGLSGKLEEAYRILDLIEDTNDREVRFLQADLLIEENRMEEADEVFTQLAEEEEYDLATLMDIVLDYIDVGQQTYADKWAHILFEHHEVKEQAKENQQLRDVLCDYYTTFNKPQRAIPLLRTTLEQQPYSARHWTELAKCYIELYHFPEAHEALDFALAINDKDEFALSLKALAYRQTNNMEESIEHYKKLIEISANKISQIFALVQTCFDARQYQLGLDYLLPLLKEETEELTKDQQSMVNVNIAMCYAGLKQPEKGYPYIETAKIQNGENPEILIQIGRYFLMQRHKEEKAIHEFETALNFCDSVEEREEILVIIASTCFDTRYFGLAACFFEQIANEFPKMSKATYFFLMCCYYYLDERPKLVSCLNQLKQEIPDMYENLGTENGMTNDKEFNDLVRELKKGLDSGDLNVI